MFNLQSKNNNKKNVKVNKNFTLENIKRKSSFNYTIIGN
jgi:hypothetical protein